MSFVSRALSASLLLLMSAWLSIATVQAEEAPEVIRIGVPDLSTRNKPYAPGALGIAQRQHQLEEAFASRGTRIEWHFFRGAGPAINEALANGQLDVVGLGDLAAIIGRSGGLKTRVLMGSRGSNMFLASRPEANIARAEDLKGKRVALYRGTADQLSFGRLLAEAGLREQDLKITSLDWSAAAAALLAGQVDATWSNFNVLSLRDKGMAIPLSTQTLSPHATVQGATLATQDFIDRYPQATQTLVDVLVDIAGSLSEPVGYQQYLVGQEQASGIPVALAKEESKGADLRFRSSPRLDSFLTASLEESLRQAHELRLVRRQFDVAQWLEPRFVEQSIARHGASPWPRYDAQGKAQP
ncbi:ABC transporter substrate-binding protein [Pseudomonas sp. KFB-139]|uniref:ABC transporter substrate-binding protein n=1 Tax=Pseudomonas serbiensis TaxID=3064350 RepID=A0ABT9CJY2_9PSED|nr:ABC transporter substrate-binding protein [Pseudomonas sp. KFB-138]MDO7925778.1 ABC transporter substrate-binding protein [Pseudomonas sp. KFB-138]